MIEAKASSDEDDSTADDNSFADELDSCANEIGARSATASEIALMRVFITCSAFLLLQRH